MQLKSSQKIEDDVDNKTLTFIGAVTTAAFNAIEKKKPS